MSSLFLLLVRADDKPYTAEDHHGEENRVGVETVKPHEDREPDGHDGLQVGVAARNGRGDEPERVVQQEVRQVGRHDQHEERGKQNRGVHRAEVNGENIVRPEGEHDEGREAVDPAQEGGDAVFRHELLEPYHVGGRDAGRGEDQQVTRGTRLLVSAIAAREDYGHGAREAEEQTECLALR